MSQVVSANRLRDGRVVFLGAGDQWVEHLAQALVFDATAIEAAMGRATGDVRGNRVVDLYAFDVIVGQGKVQAKTLRDSIRATGPSVHPDHGKMAAR